MDFTEEEKEKIKLKVEKLGKSKFKQQMLWGWRPIPSFTCALSCFIIFGLLFLGLGIMIFLTSSQI